MADTQVKNTASSNSKPYPVSFSVDYPEKLSRWSTLFRWILAIPIYLWSQSFMLHLNSNGLRHHAKTKETMQSLKATAQQAATNAHAHISSFHFGHHHHLPSFLLYTSAYIMLPVFLMIVFRRKYPKWVFDFNVGLLSFCQRVMVYIYFMTDQYPNSDQAQSVHLVVEYPEQDTLNRWLPFVKWFLAIPHYVCLAVLSICSIVVTLLSWIAILFTGHYPKMFFDFNVGVMQWFLRVTCYVGLLATDKYPPFSLS